ncbi:MAG: UDP-N-acetylmuramoyl-L-alanine--D-glutamate ligase [Asticcacaulis sp.]
MIPVRGFEGKRVAVFGLGRSGLTAARALKAGGAEPLLWDDQAKSLTQAAKEGFTLENLKVSDWSEIDALMLSPGVPLTHPEPHWTVQKAKAAGVPVIGDIELFASSLNRLSEADRPRTVAITGTNGKSTTTALISWILQQAGRDVRMGGNIGIGVLDLADFRRGAVYVIETSSYQLDLTHSFAPDVAVLLNFSPDHLDRHGGMDGYVAAKRRIFAAQRPEQTAVIGADDSWCQAITTDQITLHGDGRGPAVVPVSARRVMGRGIYALQGVIYDSTSERTREVANLAAAQSLRGRHNWQNAVAATAACRALGLSDDAIRDGLLSFPGLAHRMQEVGRIGKVRFVNDSKATNADAARQAMLAYDRFFWIAGGRAKAGGIEELSDLFERVEGAFLIGEAAELFAATLGSRVPVTQSRTLLAATAQAFAAAEAFAAKTVQDAVVLLSPACASFDQFPDFEARGEAFAQAVRDIAASEAQKQKAAVQSDTVLSS